MLSKMMEMQVLLEWIRNNLYGMMAKHILKCSGCGEYTMNEVHSCGSPALLVKPAKYSPEDKYGKYRRETKKELFRKEGLL